MQTGHQVLGIDASQRTLVIARYEAAGVAELTNTVAAIQRWLAPLPVPCALGIESTGRLHTTLVTLATAAGHTVYLLNPRDVHFYARALGRRAKTDRVDAQLIARYVAQEHAQLHPFTL